MKHVTLFSFCGSPALKASRMALTCAVGIALSLTVSGCSDEQPAESFSSPTYSYLPTLHLNVNHINVDNHVTFNKDDLATQSPVSSVQTLTLMAQQRLKATGSTGDAQFAITRATISKAAHHQLDGTLSVQLTLDDPMTQHHGHITATIHQIRSFPSENSRQKNLYTLNQAMMDDMNVELEYQVRKHLSDWLTDAAGTPLNATVKSQDLGATQSPLSSETLTPPPGQGNAPSPSVTPSTPK